MDIRTDSIVVSRKISAALILRSLETRFFKTVWCRANGRVSTERHLIEGYVRTHIDDLNWVD